MLSDSGKIYIGFPDKLRVAFEFYLTLSQSDVRDIQTPVAN